MNGGQVLARVGELALEHGPEIVDAVSSIIKTILGEHPELNPKPLPAEGAAMRTAKERAEEAIRRAEDDDGDPPS